MSKFADICVPIPVRGLFTYSVPEDISEIVLPGVRVFIRFGGRRMTGVVFRLKDETDLEKVEPILDVVDEEPFFSPKDLEFIEEAARHYGASLGEMLSAAVPPGFFREEKLRYRITGKGLEEFERARGRERDALALFTRPTGVTRGYAAKELKKLGYRAPGAKIASLVRAGLVEAVRELKKETHARQRVVLRLEREPLEGERISESARKVVELVREMGEVERGRLLEATGVTPGVIQRLISRGILGQRLEDAEVVDREGSICELPVDISLTPHQREAIDRIIDSVESSRGEVFLLHGITGSGKTEVYIRAVERVVEMGLSACVLIPEISLTPLTLGRFRRKFGDLVGVFHSRMTPTERATMWERVRRGATRVVIGPRSALFVPIRNPGLIVVDEEHDPAYKQEDGLKYNARDLAILKGKMFSIPVVLGSATPSAETFFRAKTGRYTYLELPERVAESVLPDIEIVDLSKTKVKRGMGRYISDELKEAIDRTLEEGGKVMLFVNRRGFAPWVMCLECGYVEKCENCSVSLTLHRDEGGLLCHYCGFRKEEPAVCRRCGGTKIAAPGVGTEKIEQGASRTWKGKVVVRMDSDTMRRKGAYGDVLGRMQEGEIDILVGTQMISKGHDFPQVTLVGVILADLSLVFPDFRSSERTFQVLTQVAGRAGRRGEKGKVIIQTFHPNHYAISKAKEHDYAGFMEMELSFRAELSYPPFSRLLLIRCVGSKEESVLKRAREVVELLMDRFGDRTDVKILGPSPAPIQKLKRNYIQQILVKAAPETDFSPFIEEVVAEFGGRGKSGGVKIDFDVDPYQLLH